MSWLEVVLLSVVEGLTEFLPISSTGHLIIVSHIINIPQTEFLKSFSIIIQLGAILAVLSKYWTLIWKRKDYWPKIIAAFVPTVLIGLALYDIEKRYLLGNLYVTIAGLFFGSIGLIGIEWWLKHKPLEKTIDTMSFKQAFIIGICQTLAIVPGVSRSASTILAGMVTTMTRKAAVEFSFLLALPVMAGATLLDVTEMGVTFSKLEWYQLFVGMVISFVVARLTVDWLVRFVEKNSFTLFGWYRIVLAALLLLGSTAGYF